MADFSQKEKSELLQFIQHNFTKEQFVSIELIIALALNIDIQGLTINEIFDKTTQALQNTTNFNEKIVELCSNETKKKDFAEKLKQRLSKLANESLSVKSRKAKQLVSPTDRVTKILFDSQKNPVFYGDTPQTQKKVKVGEKNKKTVSVLVTIDTTDLEKHITLSDDTMLNPYNRAVHDAVISLYSEGNTYFTEDMIYRFMNGYRTQHEAPANAKKDIHDALRNLMYTGIKLDATNEANAFGIKEFTFEGHVLPLTYTRGKINGEVRECWKILDRPPLLVLAERKNQINRCDVKMLDTGLNFTQDNVILTNYLLEQILAMQNEKSKRNCTILYDTVYTYLGVDALSEKTAEKKRKRIREKMKTILEAWVKSGFIESYGEFLEGRKILGIHVQIKKKD